MKLIVGLGNPGKLYLDSRHNIGFFVVKLVAKAYKIAFKRENGISVFSGKGKIAGQNVILAMPLTFMNLSGSAVKSLIKKYKIDLPDELLVVCDDLDLDFGRLKIKGSGSSGGHRGLGSIIDTLGTQGFSRLRIGIGRPSESLVVKTSDYVLSNFTRKERAEIPRIAENAGECCRVWVRQGINESMNIFNRRSK